MQISCEKDVLINNINIVTKAVSSKTTLPILECILLMVDQKGFRLIANDLELGIETSNMEAEVYELGSVALEARMFFDIVKSLPDNIVEITVDEKNIAVIKSGKSEFKLLGQNGNEFPLLPQIEKISKMRINAVKFKNMIRQTIFSVAVEENRPILTGELIEIKNGFMNLVAIDGFRVSFRTIEMPDFNDDIEVVIPAKALNEVSKILSDKEENIIDIYFTDKHILFEMDSCIIVSRILDGEYIKYEQLFTDDHKTLVKINRDLFIKSLERATLVSKESKKTPVSLNIKDNTLIVTSNTELGESYDEINIETDGDDLEIGFNPKYLIDAMKAIDEEFIKLQFMTSLSPCIIRGMEREDYKYLVLPLKL